MGMFKKRKILMFGKPEPSYVFWSKVELGSILSYFVAENPARAMEVLTSRINSEYLFPEFDKGKIYIHSA